MILTLGDPRGVINIKEKRIEYGYYPNFGGFLASLLRFGVNIISGSPRSPF